MLERLKVLMRFLRHVVALIQILAEILSRI
jgi:hypothetical protein